MKLNEEEEDDDEKYNFRDEIAKICCFIFGMKDKLFFGLAGSFIKCTLTIKSLTIKLNYMTTLSGSTNIGIQRYCLPKKLNMMSNIGVLIENFRGWYKFSMKTTPQT